MIAAFLVGGIFGSAIVSILLQKYI